ncbi:Protein of unknown function [Sphingomonas sp. YR710]|jgi:hypothetical protein|uniref:DUF3617 domain-containing protein n=1 Tax=Sphingomonas sp. YR710 TaxID=1882773 RepID=UPI000882276A|nr:DUF3617 family protein [Sphingomonas sp. YR710]SDD43357.1 Protein of unknown function [Sphingomonas sp. YR710]
MTPRSILLIATLTALAAPAFAGDSFMPGAWAHETVTVSAEVPGFPQWMIKLFSGNTKRKSCYTPADVASRPEALLTQDDAATCKLRRFSMVGGTLIYDTFCTNKRFPDGLLVASKGHYTATNYSLATLTTGTRNGEPVKIVTTGSGQRTGPCK